MRLFKMEIYKLYHEKVFLWGVLSVIGLMMIFFWFAEVGDELAVIGEKSYSGYEAVQVNRKITKEFEGIITDEKIDQIIKKYGIPSKLGENMPNWRDGNYLNDFVVLYFTDGSWQAQILPTQIYTLEESELGKVCENRGITPALEYVKGWRAFVDLLQFGLILGSIVVICSVSTVFAKEGQTKMLPLIFTTEEGRRKDVYSKVFAAFLLTATVFIGIVLLDFILCNLVYGMDGFTNMTGIVLGEKMLRAVYQVNFPQYLVRLLLFGLQGLSLLCAITLVISANHNTSFATVIVSAVCWGMPVILRMFLMGMSAIFIYATPLFLVMHGCLDDVYGAGGIVLCISLLTGIICTVVGFLKYKTKEA